MVSDRQSNPVSGSTPEAVRHFDDALRSFNIYRGDPLAALDAATAAAPAFVQAHLLKAFILALATEPAATADAAAIAARLRPMPLDEREASQLAVLDALIAGNWVAAATAMDFHNMRYPRDLAALQVGHLLDFYRGSARDLRDRIARALPAWSPGVPGYHAVARGEYRAAVEALHPVRFGAHQFGGSHAQRDVIDWTLTEAAIRAGMRGEALALAHERVALKPHSPVNREFLRRAGAVTAELPGPPMMTVGV